MNSKESYRDNILLKKVGVKVSYTQEELEEFIKCSQDQIYFIKNYIKIVNVDQGLVKFDMWDFQEDMVNTFHENRFSITKCPRQVGKCVQLNTTIRLRNKKTGEIIETTVGEFYEKQAAKKSKLLPKE
jgi:hypothetical protein